MKIKRNAAFKLFTYGKNKDKYQIRLRVTFNSQRIDLGTNCQINFLGAWDTENELVRPGYKGPKEKLPPPSTMSCVNARTPLTWCSSTTK